MFLQATFLTTAGNRSEAFFPRAIIWVVGSRSEEKEKREGQHLIGGGAQGAKESCSLSPGPFPKEVPFLPLPAPHRHYPLHGLQLEGILVGVQHLLQVVMPSERHKRSAEGTEWGWGYYLGGSRQKGGT